MSNKKSGFHLTPYYDIPLKLTSDFEMHWFECPFTHVSTLNIWFSVAHTIIIDQH